MKKVFGIFLVFAVLCFFAYFFTSANAETSKTTNEQQKRYIVYFSDDADKAGVSAAKNWIMSKGSIKYDWTEDSIKAMAVFLPESKSSELQTMLGIESIKEDIYYASVVDLAQSVPMVRSDQVWAQEITGQGARVCIVDTGVGPHPKINIVAQYDFVNDDSDASDDLGHGTHCAGIVESRHTVQRGNAYDSVIMAAKTIDNQGSGYQSDTVAGIYWCAKGPDGQYNTGDEADIISISLGFSEHVGICDSEPAAAAANDAVDHGVFVVASSGNDCSTNFMGNPACGSKVVSVGAIYDANLGLQVWSCCEDIADAYEVACFSNGNQYLDFVAPGSIITSTVPSSGCEYCDPSYLYSMSGTSMAAPHVAGIAALLLDENPNLTPASIKQILISTSIDLGYPTYRQGNGMVAAFAAWLDVHGPECTEGSQCSDGNSCTYDICDEYQLCTNEWRECNPIQYDGCCSPSCVWPQDIDCNPCGNHICDNEETLESCPQDCNPYNNYHGSGYTKWREYVENTEAGEGIW